jgi:3-hydroxymyristoyl/3-hydroxydecanoyl-(acyl carrier protein) dehydratase
MMSDGGHFTISADHPALPGHFPGAPIVPGVVLLDHTLALLARHVRDLRLHALRKVKFLAPVLPGEEVSVLFRQDVRGDLTFNCVRRGETILAGVLASDTPEGEA